MAGTPIAVPLFTTIKTVTPYFSQSRENSLYFGSVIIVTGAQPEGGGAFFNSGVPHRGWPFWRNDPSIFRRRQNPQVDNEDLHKFFTTQPHLPFPRQEDSGFIAPKLAETVIVVMPPELQKFLISLPGWKAAPNYVIDVSQKFSMGVPYPILLGTEALHFVVGQPHWQEQIGYVFDSSSVRSVQISAEAIVDTEDFATLRRRRR